MNNAEIFRKAADYIREHGLWKSGQGDPGGCRPRCVALAIVEVDGFGSRAVSIAAARATSFGDAKHLYAWNDHPDRTAEEVVTMLDNLAFDEDLKAAAQSPLPADTTIPVAVQIPQLVEA